MLLLSNANTPIYQHLISLKPVKQVKPVMSSNTTPRSYVQSRNNEYFQ